MPASGANTSLAGSLILLFVLIVINAIFCCTEMAVVSINKNKIKLLAQQGNKRAKAVQKLIEQPNKFLSTTQVWITLAGFLASAFAAVGISHRFSQFLTSRFDIPYSDKIGVILVTLILSYVTLVIGEIYPKRIALHHSEGIAMAIVRPLMVISTLTKPFVWLLSVSVNGLLLLTRQKLAVSDDEFSEDEVMSMLEVGQESGVLKEEGKKMINSIFAFDDKLAHEIMTPRTDVFLIDINDPAEEYVDELMELRYSRIPVCEDDSDAIIGILYIKDYLIKAREAGFENVDIRGILRKPYLVPETKNIDSLFVELQKTKQHIAILIDEYGGFSGIVTMEDIIEEIMGDIDDEYDEEEPKIEALGGNTYLIDGAMDLDDINEELGINLESDSSETLGGFIIDLLGEILGDGEGEGRSAAFENYTFTIESVKERRIEKAKLRIGPAAGNDYERGDL